MRNFQKCDDRDIAYSRARNLLIPEAERYANKAHRVRFPGGHEAARAAWFAKWSRAFHSKMTQLAKERGL
jgi:hypothetical protein